MRQTFVMEYWKDGNYYVGRLRGVPGVFSQGETLAELEENIRDGYELMTADTEPAPDDAQTVGVEINV